MLIALHTLPDLAILLLVAVAMTLLCVLAPLAGRHVLRLGPNDARDGGAFDAFKAVMNVLAVVLAFCLVQSITNLRSAEALVAKEAASFNAVDRALARYGTPETSAIRPALALYGQSRVNAEWPGMAEHGRSEQTDQAFRAVSRPARAIQPANSREENLHAELLRGLEELAEQREIMLAIATQGLPAIFYTTAFGVFAIALVMAAGTVATPSRLLGLGAFGASIGLLLAFVLVMDMPFSGQTSASPAPIATILKVNAARP